MLLLMPQSLLDHLTNVSMKLLRGKLHAAVSGLAKLSFLSSAAAVNKAAAAPLVAPTNPDPDAWPPISDGVPLSEEDDLTGAETATPPPSPPLPLPPPLKVLMTGGGPPMPLA